MLNMTTKQKAINNLVSKKLWGFIILSALLTVLLFFDKLDSTAFASIMQIVVPAYFVSNAYQDRAVKEVKSPEVD